MNSGKWIFCTVLFLTMSMGMSYGQMAAGSNRPASVPSDYVITPFGYFHPSCVREIKEGETVLADGRIRFENGTEEANIPFCNFPRYTSRGEPVVKGSADPGPLYISWDWIEAGQVSTSSSSYGKITATWTVPMTPATNDGQTLFFFPGFMDINDVELIIQPVLGWNDGQSGVGPWNIASWNCCPSGTANYSTPVTVNTGDVIQGIIKGTCKAGTQSCSTWNITTKDVTTGKQTVLKKTPSEGQTFNWAQSGVLEVYSISQCSDFPPDGSIKFSKVALFDYNYKTIKNPGWTPMYWVQQGVTDPWCNYGVTTTAKSATLTY
jgi:hypothetical protein